MSPDSGADKVADLRRFGAGAETVSVRHDVGTWLARPEAVQMNFDLNVAMPSDPRFLAVVRSAVTELSSVCGLSDSDSRAIALAIDEALANIIRHAYKSRHDQAIQLKCEASPDCLQFTLFDQGEPADLAKICALPLNNDSLSGRGTHMIQLIMDEVSYERVAGGNRLRLRKLLPTANAVAERE